MNIKLTNYKGTVLKTAGTYTSEDIVIVIDITKYDGTYEDIKSSYTVTITASDDGGGGRVTYTTDNGLTGTVNSGDTITLDGVTSISILFDGSAPAAQMLVNDTSPWQSLPFNEPTTLTITQDTTLDIMFMWM